MKSLYPLSEKEDDLHIARPDLYLGRILSMFSDKVLDSFFGLPGSVENQVISMAMNYFNYFWNGVEEIFRGRNPHCIGIAGKHSNSITSCLDRVIVLTPNKFSFFC